MVGFAYNGHLRLTRAPGTLFRRDRGMVSSVLGGTIGRGLVRSGARLNGRFPGGHLQTFPSGVVGAAGGNPWPTFGLAPLRSDRESGGGKSVHAAGHSSKH